MAGKTAAKRKPAPVAEATTVKVKVGAFPGGKVGDFELPAGSTVRDALLAARLINERTGSDERDVRLNGQRVTDLNTLLVSGNQVLMFSKVRGN